jgi:hypothetical protein
MKKPTIILLLILTIVGCQNNQNSKINENQLRNKTFTLIEKTKNDTLTFEFRDSTYNVFEFSDRNIPWGISHFDNSSFLVLDNRVIGIKQKNNQEYECKFIGLSDWEFKMIERNPKWKKEQIYGTWIEEKFVGTDSIDFPPPPIENVKSNWPPNYKITENKIQFDFYEKTESKIEINNTGEFITMELKNPIFYGTTENLWQIKFVSDSLMIVDKQITEFQHFSQQEKEIGGIRLIKKR